VDLNTTTWTWWCEYLKYPSSACFMCTMFLVVLLFVCLCTHCSSLDSVQFFSSASRGTWSSQWEGCFPTTVSADFSYFKNMAPPILIRCKPAFDFLSPVTSRFLSLQLSELLSHEKDEFYILFFCMKWYLEFTQVSPCSVNLWFTCL
jgi:hypothetical protein